MLGECQHSNALATFLFEMLQNQFIQQQYVCECCKTNSCNCFVSGMLLTNGLSNFFFLCRKTNGFNNIAFVSGVKPMVLATLCLEML